MSNLLSISGSLRPNTTSDAVPVRLTTTGITDLYTATNNLDTVVAVQVTSELAGAATILIDHFDGTTNWHTWALSTAAIGSTTFSDFPVRLLNGHKIRATASVANQYTVSLAIVTISRNVGGGTMGPAA